MDLQTVWGRGLRYPLVMSHVQVTHENTAKHESHSHSMRVWMAMLPLNTAVEGQQKFVAKHRDYSIIAGISIPLTALQFEILPGTSAVPGMKGMRIWAEFREHKHGKIFIRKYKNNSACCTVHLNHLQRCDNLTNTGAVK